MFKQNKLKFCIRDALKTENIQKLPYACVHKLNLEPRKHALTISKLSATVECTRVVFSS